MTPRANCMTGPLIEGQFYLVPTVKAKWYGKLASWPVIGPLHEDVEFFRFRFDHYHVDARFLARGVRNPYRVYEGPLHVLPGEPPLPKPVMSRRRCVRAHLEFHVNYFRDTSPLPALRKHFAGRQCAHGKGGWICPHRKASLGSIVPVDGIITCPLHGLQINAASGKVLEASTP